MNDQSIRSIEAAEVSPGTTLSAALLALNNAHAQELSWLEPERLQHLVRESFYARRIGDLDAFLIAFDQDARYDSPNFLWFRDRYERFAYVDRVVVSASAHGQGLGRRLYEKLFADARAAGYPCIVAEVNTVPANPGSLSFHDKMGFETVGDLTFSPDKSVRYFARSL